MRAAVIAVVVCLATAALPGCRPLGPPEVKTRAAAVEALPSGDAIPAAWGRLAGVSSVAQYPDLIQLWFEDDAGVVRVAVYRATTGELINARRIARG
jgi:CelD/BcsL family acetyltransferase involved in cellulose biosynthesis